MKPTILERLRHGTKPIEILKEIKATHPNLSNHRLVDLFDEDGDLTLDGVQGIWYWKEGRAHGGLDNEELNAILVKDLQNAGLI